MSQNNWQLVYDNLTDGVRSYGEESLLTLGNGYLGWRGAPVMTSYSDDHYPGVYAAGVFNQTTTPVAGRDVVNEDLVNLPNPQLINLFVDDELVSFAPTARESILHFDTGVLSEKFTLPTAKGDLILETQKVVNPYKMHQLALNISISGDFNANVTVQAVIDGTIENKNVKRYRDFESREFDVIDMTDGVLTAQTKQSKIILAVGAKTTSDEADFVSTQADNQIVTQAQFKLTPTSVINIDRIIGVATSYEEENPVDVVSQQLTDKFADIKADVKKYWQNVWQDNDIVLDSDDADMQRMIRMNIFHMHQSAQHNANQYLDASVGSRGLTGEGYRGHIFWDEIFVVPYLAANEPAAAKDILKYRLTRLHGAQLNAQSEGEVGAMYPWQSGMTGDEQAQIIHLNTVNNEWDADNSRLQRHVSLAVVYNLWVYVQMTGDDSILREGGLDVVVETSKFWLNKAQLEEDNRYHIAGVMGPDEFHEAYPNAETGGIKDNAYTNLMLTWALNWLQELGANQQLPDIDQSLLAKAKDVANKLALEINDDGVIAQYAGYFDLKSVDFDAYRAKYTDIHRIDRLMKAEGLSPDDYQVAKQTDLLITIYNLGHQHMLQLIEQLGYSVPENWLQVNKDYYLARTVHGSTTSRPVFAGIDITLDNKQEALEFLTTAIGSDYYDIQGGTTAEGIHIGVMGETLAVIQNEFGGVNLRDGAVVINPSLPASWRHLSFKQRFQGTLIAIDIVPGKVTVSADHDIVVTVYNQGVPLVANEAKVIEEV
ncbi:glycosyl hydrolase family 65 protein [Weissella hellenica]|uniref:glycosyl hydrolase family 65 protein n=1 Tax=Weissella hellenica TaxID=46256 RepID=UPI003883F376